MMVTSNLSKASCFWTRHSHNNYIEECRVSIATATVLCQLNPNGGRFRLFLLLKKRMSLHDVQKQVDDWVNHYKFEKN